MAIVKDFYADKLRVRLFDTRAAMGECAGAEAAAAIKQELAEKETINLMVVAAPSQNEVLAALVSDTEIEWERINVFQLDEYAGLDASHSFSCLNFLKKAIFDVKPFRTVNIINGNAADYEAEAERYAKVLAENPLDVLVYGIGENGHLGFNDPPVADFNDPKMAKAVELELPCRMQQVHDGNFATLDEVPTHAYTITIPALMKAKHKFCVVPGATKAEAMEKLVKGPIATSCPASIMRDFDGAQLYGDVDSGKALLD